MPSAAVAGRCCAGATGGLAFRSDFPALFVQVLGAFAFRCKAFALRHRIPALLEGFEANFEGLAPGQAVDGFTDATPTRHDVPGHRGQRIAAIPSRKILQHFPQHTGPGLILGQPHEFGVADFTLILA